MADTLMAGGAKVAITPPLGSAFQSSRADLRVESVYHDLYATAVVLGDGERKVAIVGLDVLGLDATLVNAVRARVEQQTDISGANVLITPPTITSARRFCRPFPTKLIKRTTGDWCNPSPMPSPAPTRPWNR